MDQMNQQNNGATPAPATSQRASSGNFQCPTCCAPRGKQHVPGCPETGLASAVRMAIEILAQVDMPKVPLAVPAALGVLRTGLESDRDGGWITDKDRLNIKLAAGLLKESKFYTAADNLIAILAREPDAASPDELPTAARDVLAERRRQVQVEGYDAQHDDEQTNDEIAAYAAFFAMPPAAREWPAIETGYGATWGKAIVPQWWPIPQDDDRRRELVKAGALILAEIERIDRAAAAAGRTKGGAA